MAPSALSPTTHDIQTRHHDSPAERTSLANVAGKKMVFDIMSSRVAAIKATNFDRLGRDDAFILADMGDVYRKHMAWKSHLGRVKPHYGKRLVRRICMHMLTSTSCEMQFKPPSPELTCRSWYRL